MIKTQSNPPRTRWGSARKAFTGIRNIVMERIAAGEPATEIYADLAPAMSYRSFALHVRKARLDRAPARSKASTIESHRDKPEQWVIQSESPSLDEIDPITAAIRAKAAPGTFERLKPRKAYNPRENTIEELFGVDENGNPVGER